MVKSVLWTRMAAAVVLVCALPALAPAQQVTEIDPTSLGGTSVTPYDINSVGQVTGSYVTSSGLNHAFIWTTSGILDIESDPNATSYGLALNDAAVVVGRTQDTDGDTIAFRWAPPGPMERLTIFDGASIGGRESTATDINNAGVIVGYARGLSLFGLVDRPYRLNAGAATGIDLGTLGGFVGSALAINASGQIAGQSEQSFVDKATLWPADPAPVPIRLSNATSYVSDLNNEGTMAGSQYTGFVYVPRLWRIVSGNVVSVPLNLLPGHTSGGARGTADQSSPTDPVEIVGFSSDGQGDVHAVRWVVDALGNQTLEDLNDLLPEGSGWFLTSASGINNRGQITGSGILNGESRGFVFDPEGEPPEPPSLVFLHGILGDHLYWGFEKQPDGTVVPVEEIFPPLPITSDLLKLQLGIDENPINTSYPRSQDILLELFPLGPNIYKSLPPYLDGLKQTGVITDWHAYTYDWRFDWPRIVDEGSVYDARCFNLTAQSTFEPKTCNECQMLLYENACIRLEDKVDQLSMMPEGTQRKVWLVAHSYGGLVTKALLSRVANIRDHLAGVILVASPQLGTPQTFMSVLHGYSYKSVDYLAGDRVRQASKVSARSWPMTYHLLPSREYFNRVLQPVFEFNSINPDYVATNAHVTDWFERYDGLIYDFEGMKDFLLPGNPTRTRPPVSDVDTPEVLEELPFDEADADHQEILPLGPNSFTPPLPIYQIVGVGFETVRGIQYTPSKDNGIESTPLYTCDGDGTVVAPSAAAIPDATTFYLNLAASNRGITRINRRHRDILEVDSVRELITAIILGTDTSRIKYISQTKPTTDCKGAGLRTRSPAVIHVFQDGLHTGPLEDGPQDPDALFIEEKIPNSRYDGIGEGQQVLVDDVGMYDVELKGTGVGTVSLEGTRFEGDETEQRFLIEDLPVRIGTRVSFVLDPALETIPDLTVDVEGDGVPEFVIHPGAEPTPDDFLTVLKSAVQQLRSDTGDADFHWITYHFVRTVELHSTLHYLDLAERALHRKSKKNAIQWLGAAKKAIESYKRGLDRAVRRGRVEDAVANPLMSTASDIIRLSDTLVERLTSQQRSVHHRHRGRHPHKAPDLRRHGAKRRIGDNH